MLHRHLKNELLKLIYWKNRMDLNGPCISFNLPIRSFFLYDVSLVKKFEISCAVLNTLIDFYV